LANWQITTHGNHELIIDEKLGSKFQGQNFSVKRAWLFICQTIIFPNAFCIWSDCLPQNTYLKRAILALVPTSGQR